MLFLIKKKELNFLKKTHIFAGTLTLLLMFSASLRTAFADEHKLLPTNPIANNTEIITPNSNLIRKWIDNLGLVSNKGAFYLYTDPAGFRGYLAFSHSVSGGKQVVYFYSGWIYSPTIPNIPMPTSKPINTVNN